MHTSEDWKEKVDLEHLYVDYKNIVKVVKPGDLIYVDDGLIALEVKAVNADAGELTTEVVNSGKLGSKKGCPSPPHAHAAAGPRQRGGECRCGGMAVFSERLCSCAPPLAAGATCPTSTSTFPLCRRRIRPTSSSPSSRSAT